MAGGVSRELSAVANLARALEAVPGNAEAVVDTICSETRAGFGLERASIVSPAELAAAHPLVEEAARARRAVTDGRRVAVPLEADGSALGILIGDAAGNDLELDEPQLALLSTLAAVAAVVLARVRELDRLQRLLDVRNRFVALASHELRSAIAIVHGVVSTLHVRGDMLEPAERRELQAAAFEHTARLARLTEQLLDVSRLESGIPIVYERRFRLRSLVEEVLARVARERPGDVVNEVDPALELVSDPDALERIVSNLVGNALRYAQPPVRVRTRTGSRLRLVVEDTGPGIDPEFVPRLFDRFSRGVDDHAGAGLGLAIASAYARALGASLAYEPRRPTGARFTLALPQRVLAPSS